jgi:zinc protease
MKEVNIQVDGYRRKKDDQSDLGLRALYTMIYKKKPYGWTFDEVIKGLQALKVHDLTALHHEYINPSHFVLSVVGDFDLDEMETTLNELLTHWEDKVPYKAQNPRYVDFEQLNQDIPLLRDQTFLLLGRPSQLNFLDPDFVAVQLLNITTFLALGSRIYQVREQTGLFYMATGSWAAQATREQGIDMLFTILNPDNVAQAEVTMRALINEVGTHGISLDELKAAKQLYIKQMIDILSSYRSVAAFLARVQTFKLDSNFYDNMLKKGQAISLEEINTIARKYFHDEALARIRVGRTPTTLNT